MTTFGLHNCINHVRQRCKHDLYYLNIKQVLRAITSNSCHFISSAPQMLSQLCWRVLVSKSENMCKMSLFSAFFCMCVRTCLCRSTCMKLFAHVFVCYVTCNDRLFAEGRSRWCSGETAGHAWHVLCVVVPAATGYH